MEIVGRSMSTIRHFYHLSRPSNVGITLLAFFLSCFLANDRSVTFLQTLDFYVAAICLALVTASGYWINDVYDHKIDRINKPHKLIVNAFLSVKKVLSIYFTLVFLITGASILLLNPALTLLNLGAAFLLFIYAAWLKRTTIVGNLTIAALTALVVYDAMVLYHPKMVLVWAAIFAFEANFVREIIKDLEDIEGDLRFKLHTLPIRAGTHVAKRVVAVGYGLFAVTCPMPFFEIYLRTGRLNFGYLIAITILVVFPTILLRVDLRNCNSKADFTKQSRWLKLLILAGMLSLLLLN